MSRFVDEAEIVVRSGNGGPGAVSFRREKYVPKGGPDGGDGGDGGDVLFRVKKDLRSLYALKMKGRYRAEDGRPGGGKNKTGARGRDCVIAVPVGSVITERESKQVLADLTVPGGEILLLKGGRGGLGNARFATSVNRAPRYAQKGLQGKECALSVQIKTIADIGIVGLPNAGKSTLLSVLTEARPKIGDYPFTTLTPNLGVMSYKGTLQFIIADMPGLVEGASGGHGLGIRFLRHIERTKGLLLLLDLSKGDFHAQHDMLLHEIASYSGALMKKPRLVVGSKQDAAPAERIEEFLRSGPGESRVCVSSVTRHGIGRLRNEIAALMEKVDETQG
jgi:GTP-binding protein